jgi:hypothetical protein
VLRQKLRLPHSPLDGAKAAYAQAKKRANLALQYEGDRSYSVRQEYRVSLSLFRVIREKWMATRPTKPALHNDLPSPPTALP